MLPSPACLACLCYSRSFESMSYGTPEMVLAAETACEATVLWLAGQHDACQQTLLRLEGLSARDIKACFWPRFCRHIKGNTHQSQTQVLWTSNDVICCVQTAHNLAVAEFYAGGCKDIERLLAALTPLAVRSVGASPDTRSALRWHTFPPYLNHFGCVYAARQVAREQWRWFGG